MSLYDSTRTTRTTQGGSTCADHTTESDMTSEMSSSITPGSMDDYQIHHLIGRGKYSQVYSALHIPSQTNVAIKRVAIFDMMDPQARSDCLREVKILQSLEHPNIVKCFNSFMLDNELVIVLEWAESGDLAQLLQQRVEQRALFTEDDVMSIFGQVCCAMQHMHDRRMMHRDLKPGNIFVTALGVVKLGDLGLSRYFSSRTLQAISTVGTPYYMSPECIKGLPYDFSSDIWSLGILLYELITLRNPFFKEGQSLYSLGKSITNCLYEPLPEDTSQAMKRMVTDMLKADPQARPTIHQLLERLDNIRKGISQDEQDLV